MFTGKRKHFKIKFTNLFSTESFTDVVLMKWKKKRKNATALHRTTTRSREGLLSTMASDIDSGFIIHFPPLFSPYTTTHWPAGPRCIIMLIGLSTRTGWVGWWVELLLFSPRTPPSWRQESSKSTKKLKITPINACRRVRSHPFDGLLAFLLSLSLLCPFWFLSPPIGRGKGSRLSILNILLSILL